MDKQIDRIPEETLRALSSYSWPGNVRELQNLIERAVIRSNDGVLQNPLPISKLNNHLPISKKTPGAAVGSQNTLMDSTRAAILQALNAAGWVVGGSGGAAARLGLKRTTLLAKMKKLGITRPMPQNDMQTSDGEQWLRPSTE
jgi:formate hydrogenlyase transcriptional activator